MEIEVRKLNAQKKYEGRFEFCYVPPADICLIPYCSIGNVGVSGGYEINDDGSVWVDLTVSYTISGRCSYCLSPAEERTTYSCEILFDTSDNDLSDKEDDHYKYDGIKINLRAAVDDAILISQPNVLLCREDCTGIDVTKK